MIAWVLGVPISRLSVDSTLGCLTGWVREMTSPCVVNLVNAHSVVEAHRNSEHMRALRWSHINLADGWPVARMARAPRIAGADLMLAVARHPDLGKMRHVLLGGFGVAYTAAMRQCVDAAGHSPLNLRSPAIPAAAPESSLLEMANGQQCDILWVSLGCPKQEIWMHENRDKLKAKVVIGVGAAFDFLAGRVRRAPVWVQRIGLEWAWRIWADPQRWRRQISAVIGFARLLLR